MATAPYASIAYADEIYDWSNSAANNNSAPPDGFPENMNYSDVNDAARELMAVVARQRDATDGTNQTSGTQPAYTLSSGQSLSVGAAGRMHVWTAHATSTGNVTLNVDGAGAKNVVAASGSQLGSGAIVQNGVYMTVETASNHRIVGALSAPAVSNSASSVTDNTVARFDGTSGTLVQDTGIAVDDSDNVSGVGTLGSGAITSTGEVSGTSLSSSGSLTVSGTITGATTVDIGNADTTLSRASAGDIDIEGNIAYRAGGTDVPVADGGTGRSSSTAYAVIAGGTTSTGAQQSVSGVGTSGQVLTSSGASNLPTWQSPPGALIAIIEDRATAGTDGQSLSSGSDEIRLLDTLAYNRDTIVSLSSNQFTLPAGSWLIKWSASAAAPDSARNVQHQSLLRNVTDTTDVARGTTESVDTASAGSEKAQSISVGSAAVTLAGSKAFEIRHRVSGSAQGGWALGVGTEVYTRVEIYAN